MTARELVARYDRLVWSMVRRVRGNAPDRVGAEREDLYAAGMAGLWRAWLRWDESRGATFSTFAGHRVLGAIRDELRRMDRLPRSTRREIRADPEHAARRFAAPISLDALLEAGHNVAAAAAAEEDSEAWERVLGMIPTLPPRMRQVMTLLCVHGLLQVEAARLLGVTPATISVTRKKAVARMRGMVRNQRAA